MSNYAGPRRMHAVLVLLILGLALALGANVYQFRRSARAARDFSAIQHNLQTQITRLSDATSGAFEVTEHRFAELKKLQDSTVEALIDARSELRRSNSQVTAGLEKRNQELARKNRDLAAELAALKQDLNTRFQNTTARLQNTSTKLDTANARLQHVSTETESNRADLKRVAGDLSVVTAKLSNSTKVGAPLPRPPARPQPPARKYFGFDLLKTKVPTRIGEIQIALRSTDPKNNRCTMDLYSEDKIIALERDCAVNQPVQFYAAASPLPFEIVVNQVQKDEIIGYVSAPSVPPAAQTAALRNGNPSGANTPLGRAETRAR